LVVPPSRRTAPSGIAAFRRDFDGGQRCDGAPIGGLGGHPTKKCQEQTVRRGEQSRAERAEEKGNPSCNTP